MRIGFIDSGVGGLSVYQQVQQQVAADYIYLMDNKYLPYGEKSENFIQQRLYQLSQHLLELGVELIVIACNTATTQAVEYLRQHFAIPFVGVVPAIKPAATLSHGDGFAVLATPATANGNYIAGLIRQFAPDDEVVKFGSSELVRLAEDKVWYQEDVQQQVNDILSVSPIAEQDSRIVVLGCTHFPFLAEEIKHALPAATVLLETGEAIARRVKQLVGDKLVQKTQYQHCFISTRELNNLQLNRFKAARL